MKDITPKHLRCIPCSCPAVYEDGDHLIIRGKLLTDEQFLKVPGISGPDEIAVRIPKEYFADLKK